MTIEAFNWPTQIQNGMEGQFTFQTRTAQFGDGYKQITGDGINPEAQSWPVTLTGLRGDVLPALIFIRRHITKSFIWKTPLGETGLYRVVHDSVRSLPISATAMTITATFEQAYIP